MLTRHWRDKFRRIMKEYYIDNWNSMVIPNEIENIEKTVSDFYKSNVEFKFAGKQRQLNVHNSAFFDRSDLNKSMFGKTDFDNLEYPVMENVYAYVIPYMLCLLSRKKSRKDHSAIYQLLYSWIMNMFIP